MERLNYTYSRIACETVLELLSHNYKLPTLTNCQFYTLGLHDNYLIEAEHTTYILRIYRRDWRSPEEIQFELNLLDHLKTRGAEVSAPLTTKTTQLSIQLNCPEGSRSAALFNYAEGIAPGRSLSIQQSHLLGNSVAKFHLIGDTFTTHIQKQTLDTAYLLDKSIQVVKPFIDFEMQSYLKRLCQKIKTQLPRLPDKTGILGICSGDINPGNFHIDENQNITLFDFDQCGYGYRAFEIGKFISSLHAFADKHKLSQAFIEGYERIRPLTDQETLSIPCYEIMSHIWVMAIHVYNIDRIGYKHLDDNYWKRQLGILRVLDETHLK